MAGTLQDFRANFKDAARANRFFVTLGGPIIRASSLELPEELSFVCKKAKLPEINITGPTIKFRGTSMMLAGDVKHEPLELTYINAINGNNANNERMIVRNFFEDWMHAIVDTSSTQNDRNNQLHYNESNWITIQALGRGTGFGSTLSSNVLETYNFYDVVPLTLGAVELDSGSSDALQEFPITFHYSYWRRV